MNLKDIKFPIAVWAIDPFEGKLKPHRFEVKNLLGWVQGTGAKIQPVYVLKLPLTNNDQTETKVRKTIEMEAAIGVYLQEIGCTGTLAPRVLVDSSGSVESMVESLIEYSEETDAEMIIVSSRGRKGFDRFVFGSFAETLLCQSRRPLYFLTHQNGTVTEERGNRILFPTDFSAHSELVFDSLLAQAKPSKSEIILYYAVSLPPSTVMIPDNYFSLQAEDTKIEARKWINKGVSVGIKVIYLVQNVGIASSVAPSIIDVAKQKSARFIAMASNRGNAGSIFFGSVAREVSRSNLFPVWICGPRALAS